MRLATWIQVSIILVLSSGSRTVWAQERQPLRSVEGWGLLVDPVGDCRFERDADKLTITVPGEYHDLWPGKGKVNAPLVLQEAEGNFSVEVLVAHLSKAQAGSVIPGLASSVSFHAGSLVIWHNAENLVRLDRTDMNNAGRAITSCYLHVFQDGERVAEMASIVPDKPTHLRLERRDGRVTASYSHDAGTTWRTVSSANVKLPDKVKVGVSALNNTRRENTAQFEDLRISR
jgi:hypothetical protein